ncbi:polysaccharide biosynthesis protein [Bacteroidota bacterium]
MPGLLKTGFKGLRNLGIKIFRYYSLPRWMVFILDAVLVFLTFHLAFILRLNFDLEPYPSLRVLERSLFTLAIYIIFALVYKSHYGLIRYTTIRDAINIALTTASTLIILLAISVISGQLKPLSLLDIPISVLLIHFGTVTVVLFGVRVFIKMSYEFVNTGSTSGRNVLIFGAGKIGVDVSSMIQGESYSGMKVVGFIDDSPRLHGKTVNNHPVYKPSVLDTDLLSKHSISVIIFAVNNLSRERRAEITSIAVKNDIEVLEAPRTDQWLQGRISFKQLKKVMPEDLLGRDPINLNLETIQAGLEGKTILVTGAAGSIGSELVRQLIKFNPGNIILVDQAETPVFYLKSELRTLSPDSPVRVIVGDVTNLQKMESIFIEFKPEIVFHAAAYKHVPVMEENPHEAFRVNAGGTALLAELSIKHNVNRFVMISTDKAVNPTNIMGATKRLCEMYVQSLLKQPGNKTQFVTTRFGNVLGSNGSVIPLFHKQIEAGGPVTITHQDIERYFMTIPEACQLVLEAGFMGKGGEIFIFDMGKPVKIYDLAEQMIKLSGFIPNEDIMIEVIGLRPGEKLYEELMSDTEKTQPTHHPKIMVATAHEMDLSFIRETIPSLMSSLYSMTHKELVAEIKKIVPEYVGEDGM